MLGRAGRGQLHPDRRGRRRGRRSGDRPGRLRRRVLAARRALGAGRDVAAGHGRRRRRRQDRREHRGGQEPRRRVPPASRRRCAISPLWTLCRRIDLVAGLAEVVKCGFIADPEILSPGRGGSAGGRRSRQLGDAGADRAGGPGEGRRRVGGPARGWPAGDPQLRPHAGARDREGRGLPLAARARGLGRTGLRGAAGPTRGTPRRCDRRPPPLGAGTAGPTGALPGRGVARPAGDHAGRQEGAGVAPAVRRARRPGPAVHSGWPGGRVLGEVYREVSS